MSGSETGTNFSAENELLAIPGNWLVDLDLEATTRFNAIAATREDDGAIGWIHMWTLRDEVEDPDLAWLNLCHALGEQVRELGKQPTTWFTVWYQPIAELDRHWWGATFSDRGPWTVFESDGEMVRHHDLADNHDFAAAIGPLTQQWTAFRKGFRGKAN